MKRSEIGTQDIRAVDRIESTIQTDRCTDHIDTRKSAWTKHSRNLSNPSLSLAMVLHCSISMTKDRQFLTRKQSRAVDRIAIDSFAIPGIVLMENAARGVAEILIDQKPQSDVLILCGPGNNGGDGFAIARHLAIHQIRSRIGLFGAESNLSGDAKINFDIARKMRLDLEVIDLDSEQQVETFFSRYQDACWVVDALLGTGARLPLRLGIRKVLQHANELQGKRLAVDVPTGVDCDSGGCDETCFRADLTCTFVREKTGFQKNEATHFLGGSSCRWNWYSG